MGYRGKPRYGLLVTAMVVLLGSFVTLLAPDASAASAASASPAASFTWSKGWYSIVVLSTDNRTMSYGVTTVEVIARAIHHDLNPTVTAVIPPSAPSQRSQTPDEVIPALPAVP